MIGSRHDMTDEQWQRMERVMPKGLPGPPRKDDRKVTASIFFVLRTGMPWRDLPERYGPYTTCYNRFTRWSESGRWQKILEDLQRLEEAEEEAADEKDDGDPAPRSRMIDSSSIRAHRHAAGSRKDGEPQEIGRSRGGQPAKIHAMVDGKGGLRRMRLSPGQAADCAEAAPLLDGLEAGCVLIADKAYDTEAVLKQTAEAGCRAVIPSKSNRRQQRPLDKAVYAKRNVIERFFGRIKEFRRVATRFDKRARNFAAAVILTVIRCLLRNDAKGIIESTT